MPLSREHGRGGPAGPSQDPIEGAIEGKGSQVELAGIITGAIKLLIGIGIVIGLVIALLLVKLFGGSKS